MTDRQDKSSERSLRRRAIERIIAQYPDIDQEQLYRLFDYFRLEATSRDVARIPLQAVAGVIALYIITRVLL